MPRQLSRRQQAIAAYERGEGTLDEIAARFRIAAAFLARFLGLSPAPQPPWSPLPSMGEPSAPSPPSQPATDPPSNSSSAGPPGIGTAHRLDDQDLEFLRQMTTKQPHATWEELREELVQQRGKHVGPATLHRALRRLGLSKRRARQAQAPDPGGSAAASSSPPRYRPEHRRVPSTAGAYPSDLTDVEWEQVRPLVQTPNGRGRPPTQDRRRILDALFYIARTGCQWRMLPHDYPPWQTVASCFYRWTRRGVLKQVYAQLRGAYRQSVGKQEQPSAGIIDSQTVKSTEKGDPPGLMEAKRSKGGSATSSSTHSG
jgi:transposase